MKRLLTALALGLTLAFAGPAGAASKKSAPDGCAWGILQNVLDGDTVDAFYRTNDPIIWVRPSIRIRGIDTPEKGRWAKCPSEDALGRRAKAFLKSALEPVTRASTATRLLICKVGIDKYAKRRVADVRFRLKQLWQDVGDLMIGKGYAFAYDGGKKHDWCACLDHGICPPGYRGPPEP